MASGIFTESVVEDAALGWLEALGYAVKRWRDIAPGELDNKPFTDTVVQR